MNDSAKNCHDDRKDKVEAYFDLVERRVFAALASEAVQRSCSTTLLLAFATVDALGKLTHAKAKAGPGDRFRHFLASLGPRYAERSDDLWDLRNALAHNLINIESYMSSVDPEGWMHLDGVGPEGLLYVNTRKLTDDLRHAFDALRLRLTTDAGALQIAASRLQWVETGPASVLGEVVPTPPPPTQFVWSR